MKISVSNLNFLGLDTPQMQKLPPDVGLELFVEFGDDYFWQSWLERLLQGRTGPFSIHGPHQNLDLADPALEDGRMLDTLRRALEIGKRWGAADLHRSVGKGSFDWRRFWERYHRATPDAMLILEYIGVPMEVVQEDIRALRRPGC